MFPVSEPANRIDAIWVEPWSDPLIDPLGHDPKSPYVERFWLGVLGPSATWLLRSISYGFDAHPQGFNLSQSDTARVLGLGDRTGKYSPLQRAITRLGTFEFAYYRSETLVVRPRVPWLEQRQVTRLSRELQSEHSLWEDAEYQTSPESAICRRATTVAMSTIRSGGTEADVVRVLTRQGISPELVSQVTAWAVSTANIVTVAGQHAKAG
jgi:hypothetical protein